MADDPQQTPDGARSPWSASGPPPPAWAPAPVDAPPPPPQIHGPGAPPSGPGWPQPLEVPRRGPSWTTIVLVTIGATVLLVGLLVAAVMMLGSSSESKFVTVGESLPTNGSSSGSGSSGASRSNGGAVSRADLPESGLLLSDEDLADLGVKTSDIQLLESKVADRNATVSICTGKEMDAVQVIDEKWVDNGWEIDLTVADYGSETVARSQIQEKQTPEFLDCAADKYEGEHFGGMRGEVIDDEQTTKTGASTSSVQVDGRGDYCEATMVVAYRQVETMTISARMFACTGTEGEEAKSPTFDFDAADQLTGTIADRIS